MDRKQARAFEAFVEESGDGLLRVAFLLTSDRQHAEDVVQQTLERLAKRWAKVANPMAFCRRTLHNLVIDDARAAARRPREHSYTEADDASRHLAQDEYTAVELRQALLEALDTLTAHQRSIVVMRYLEDRSEAEVAVALGVSAGTVKSTASRAAARLRTHPALGGLFCVSAASEAPISSKGTP
jgi:RNA polymerase sigma-70 factor (sigma-E family)